MPTYDWNSVIGCTAKLSTTTVSNTTTETSLHSETLPNGKLDVVGTVVAFCYDGIYSTDAATPGTARFRLKLGGTTILDLTTATLPGSEPGRAWRFSGRFTIRTAGATGVVDASGYLHYTRGTDDIPREVGVRTQTSSVDVTGAKALELTVQMSAADLDNSISCTQALNDVGGNT